MWFTRISIGNPVLATMLMMAFVVLGLFSYQRLAVDQFPNVDFPTVVVVMDYPGASPEIVESEVTKKVEEAVNTVAGINSLYSRSYEGTSVVIVEFNLDVDGRKAADDVREKVSLIRPLLRDEVKEPRISRFDPAERADLQRRGDGRRARVRRGTRSAGEDAAGAHHVGRRRCCRSASRTCAASARSAWSAASRARSTSTCGRPRWRRSASASTRSSPPCATRTRNCRSARSVARPGARGADQRAAEAARGFPRHRGGAAQRRAGQLRQVADVVDGPQEVESLALYNGQRTVLLSVQKSQGENTIEVVDGLQKALAEARAVTAARRAARGQPRQLALDPRLGGERQAHPARRRRAHRADRLPVPQFLALDRHHRA